MGGGLGSSSVSPKDHYQSESCPAGLDKAASGAIDPL